MTRATRIAVGADGSGTTLQAIIDACEAGTVPARVVLVFGNKPEAKAFERAQKHGIPTVGIPGDAYESEERLAAAFRAFLERYDVDLICLAGFLRMVPAAIVREYRWRMMNSHPALLPFFGGKGWFGHHVHEGVLASGMKVAGCSVHFVTEVYDEGPIIMQRAVEVLDDDTPESLAARILPHEHEIYVEAIRRFAEGRLKVVGPPPEAEGAQAWEGRIGSRMRVICSPSAQDCCCECRP